MKKAILVGLIALMFVSSAIAMPTVMRPLKEPVKENGEKALEKKSYDIFSMDIGPPQEESYILYMTLGGIGICGKINKTFLVRMSIGGNVTKYTPPGGNGSQVHGRNLGVEAVIYYLSGDMTIEVENFTTTVKYHATEAPYFGQNISGWRFNLQQTGREIYTGIGYINHIGLHGNTTGTGPNGDWTYIILANGSVTIKPHTGGAIHYNLITIGIGKMVKKEE